MDSLNPWSPSANAPPKGSNSDEYFLENRLVFTESLKVKKKSNFTLLVPQDVCFFNLSLSLHVWISSSSSSFFFFDLGPKEHKGSIILSC